jgi:putative DNA methylase
MNTKTSTRNSLGSSCQFLRCRYEKGQTVQNYVEKWGVNDDLRELAGQLADVTDDDTHTRVLVDRDTTVY